MYETNDTPDLADILKGDSEDIQERVERINAEIEKRDDIKNENVRSLDDLILDCKNKILEIEENPYLKDSDKTTFEKAILDIEKLKLQELRNVFVDKSRWTERLIDGIIEYKQSQRDAVLQDMLFPTYEKPKNMY